MLMLSSRHQKKKKKKKSKPEKSPDAAQLKADYVISLTQVLLFYFE